MKKRYGSSFKTPVAKAGMLLLFLGLTLHLSAQSKAQFGLVVKAGNYTIPFQKFTEGHYDYNPDKKLTFAPGQVYTLGIWHLCPLGDRFQFSAELLYRNQSFSFEEQYHSTPDAQNLYISDNYRKIMVSSLALPLKLHWLWKKGGKSSCFVGAGMSRNFIVNIYNKNTTETSQFPKTTWTNTDRYSDIGGFENHLELTGGFNYQLNSTTAIGLEYTYGKTSETAYCDPRQLVNPLIDIACYYIDPRLKPQMNSFSISLRHNILE